MIQNLYECIRIGPSEFESGEHGQLWRGIFFLKQAIFRHLIQFFYPLVTLDFNITPTAWFSAEYLYYLVSQSTTSVCIDKFKYMHDNFRAYT